MTELRDKQGRTEEEFLAQYEPGDYPRPSLTADLCIFRQRNGVLQLLLVKRGGHPYLGCWATPGGFAEKDESLEQTAARELEEETGLTGITLRHTGVYSKPGRDPRGWTVSSAYTARIPETLEAEAGDDAAAVCWFDVIDTGSSLLLSSAEERFSVVPDDGRLAFDHADIIRDAYEQIRKDS